MTSVVLCGAGACRAGGRVFRELLTRVVLIGLQRSLQRDGQLLVDLVHGGLDVLLQAPLGGSDSILRCHAKARGRGETKT